jgi:hypothetical protein
LFIVSVVAWLVIINAGTENTTAVIYSNGELIDEINLSSVTIEYEIYVAYNSGLNIILVKHGEIGVIYANCPDHVCIKTGFISGGIIPVVCLPNRLEIRIKGVINELDAVAG